MKRLLAAFGQLCDYCDTLFEAARKRAPEDINCTRGCAQCCTLQSVTEVEAFAIWMYISEKSPVLKGYESEGCVFLEGNACTIYSVRPIICRTHGLLLFNAEDGGIKSTCEKNFKAVLAQGGSGIFAVDELRITENLIRLNMAMGKLCGNRQENSGRVLLADIAAGTWRPAQ